ncbi:hypothetical protein IQ279_13540 [Streptomyces verrucosisporus]|uniref:hypothetical protein n=1 Tax=Streptomyces verrucosisporus TaxID=1695161 RepID=UPI0019CFED16|nr:hypothetical protein [Streptomyces verrucosisporus]MBN3930643.1 hypothetical protein [Streptomyces verrucosisporus]
MHRRAAVEGGGLPQRGGVDAGGARTGGDHRVAAAPAGQGDHPGSGPQPRAAV